MSGLNKLDIKSLQRILIDKNKELIELVQEDIQNPRIKELNLEVASINEAIRTIRDKDSFSYLL
jgi:predicted transcriptional regulator